MVYRVTRFTGKIIDSCFVYTHTHTHTYMYIYIITFVIVCKPISIYPIGYGNRKINLSNPVFQRRDEKRVTREAVGRWSIIYGRDMAVGRLSG